MCWRLSPHIAAPLHDIRHQTAMAPGRAVPSRQWHSMQHMAAPLLHTTAVQAATSTAEVASNETSMRDAGPAPSKAARQTLNGVGVEQYPEIKARVDGSLPSWLSGTLLTNGGGDYSRMNHQYDGFAFVAKVRVADGKAWGSQRFLQTKAYREYKETGLVRYREFWKQPEGSGIIDSIKQVLASMQGAITDNASVAFAAMGTPPPGTRRVVLAMTETPNGHYLISPDDVSIVQKVHYDDGVPGTLTTVHGHQLSDGTYINFTRKIPDGGVYVVKQDPKTLRRTQVAYIPDRRPSTPSWMHDFAATDNYVALIEPPLYMSLGSMLFGKLSGSVTHLFMNWRPEDEVTVYLVPLNGGAVRTFTCPSFFFMHVGNCFESADGSTLYVDLAVYDDADILLDLTLDKLRSPQVSGEGVSRSYYKRLAIPLTEGADSRLQAPQPILDAQQQQQQQHNQMSDPTGGYCEFPVINFKYWGKPYRYAYSHCAVRPTTQGNAVSKIDVQQGTAKVWSIPGGAVGEPAFVARPDASAEDDGVVVVPGVGPDGNSFMTVLDASSWTEVARVHLPYGTPHRFHGMWVANGK